MRTVDDLLRWLRARGGVAHTSEVRAAGFTTHGIRTVIGRGAAERVRRNWLVSRDADPVLRRAASVSGRLTCVSAAGRVGLWVPHGTTRLLHVAVSARSSRLDTTALRLHWASGPAPVATRALVDGVINILFHVVRCLPRDDALAVWESALRTRVVAPETLAAVRWGSEQARAFAALASNLSDSGIETRFVALMRGLGVTVTQQVVIDGHPLDGLIGRRLAVQLDGFEHHRAADRRRDLRQDARLVILGYTVLRFDYAQVFFDPDFVVDTVAAAIAQGRHL